METSEKINLKDWSVEDRPREKLMSKGMQSLSDAELIAILLGSGNRDETAVDLAKRMLVYTKNNLNELGRLNLNDLKKFKGVGDAKGVTIMAALELGRRRKAAEVFQRQVVKQSRDVFELFHGLLGDLPHEEFWILLLNRSNKIIDKVRISQGGISGTVIDVRLILKIAVEHLASVIILCHNHPSGNTQPSEQDRNITQKVKSACSFFDISLADHVIVSDCSFLSFADEGLL
jgi:DNA repair protein RadC